MTTDQSTKEQAQATASTAADQGKHVAGVAKEEAQSVASEAAGQARNLVNETLSQVNDQMSEQTRTQRDKVVGSLQTLGDDLEKMVSGEGGGSGLAETLAREVADRARTLSSQLEGREPGELLDEVRQFARQRPGVFLLGALAAGVIAGRVARGAKDAAQSTPTSPTYEGAIPAGGTTNPPRPVATPGYQTMDAPTSPTTGIPQVTNPPGTPAVDPTTPRALDDDGPMGTPAAGYGERGALGEERL